MTRKSLIGGGGRPNGLYDWISHTFQRSIEPAISEEFFWVDCTSMRKSVIWLNRECCASFYARWIIYSAGARDSTLPPSRNGSDIDVKTFRSPGERDAVKRNGITFSEMGARKRARKKKGKRGEEELMMQGLKRLRHKNTHGSLGKRSSLRETYFLEWIRLSRSNLFFAVKKRKKIEMAISI